VMPKLVLNKDGQDRLYQANEAAGVGTRIERHVRNDVGFIVFLLQFVPRRGEEGQQDDMVRIRFPNVLNQWSALFKFSQRRAVKPDHWLVAAIEGFRQPLEQPFASRDKQPRL